MATATNGDITTVTSPRPVASNGNIRTERTAEGRIVRKRNRVPVSCIPCRAKRAKCNRGHPCARCIESSQPSECRYVARSKEVTFAFGQPSSEDLKRNAEVLNAQTTAREISMRYGAAQWHAVLEDVSGIDPELTSIDGLNAMPRERPPSLLAMHQVVPLHDILTRCLPPKATCDELVAKYYAAEYGPMPVLHRSQFMRIYDEFWREETTRPPPLWLSTMFSAFATALILEPGYPGEGYKEKLKYEYAAAQCLILAGFTTPQPWLLKALLLHYHSQYLSALDLPRELCLMVPLITRLAYESGFHREAGPHHTVFEAEMRRRIFIVIKHMDTIMAYQTGVPLTIADGTSDIGEPHNLYESDFNENTTVLPPSRPETEISPIMCFKAKTRVMRTFTRIYQETVKLKPLSESEIEKLDQESKECHASIPDALKIRPLSLCTNDAKVVVMTRLNLEFLAQRCLCVLHRKAMAAGSRLSTERCLEAASAILQCLLEMHKEMYPGHKMAGYNRLFSSTMVNDFFLAAMIMCLAVSLDLKARRNGEVQLLQQDSLARIRDLLEQSHAITLDISQVSASVRKVAGSIQNTLTKMKQYEDGTPLGQTSSAPTSSIVTPMNAGANSMPFVPSPYPSALGQDFMSYSEFDNFFSEPIDVDWSFLDQYVNLPAYG